MQNTHATFNGHFQAKLGVSRFPLDSHTKGFEAGGFEVCTSQTPFLSPNTQRQSTEDISLHAAVKELLQSAYISSSSSYSLLNADRTQE